MTVPVKLDDQYSLIVNEVKDRFTAIAAGEGRVDFERESLFAVQALVRSEYLRKCSRDSIQSAVLAVATIGLSLNPATKLAYLVPRDGQCCLDVSYIGLLKLATDSGGVLAAEAILVREKDAFCYRGPFEMPEHKFDPFASEDERGAVRGVYVVAMLPSRVIKVTTLSASDIAKIRSKSRAKSGPWLDWPEEMAKKAAIKRAAKLWPSTGERLAVAIETLNRNEHEDLPIEEGEPVEQPRAAVANSPAGGLPPPTSPERRSESDGGAGSPPVSNGAKKVLARQLEKSGLTEKDLADAGFDPATLTFAHFNNAIEWLKANQC